MENINLDKIIKADELDFNMILNVPEDIGKKIHQIIQGNSENDIPVEIIENPSESMKIEDSRKMLFKFGDNIHPITIVDFPCIIEGNKTIDYKTFYKSSDISQMFYVHEDKLKNENDLINFNPFTDTQDLNFDKILWKKDKDHQYKLKHGLAKCTRNIRAKRFKRKVKYNHEEILEVAKKLKNIIDNGAANYESQMNKTNTDFEEDNYTIDNKSKKPKSVISNDNESIKNNLISINTNITNKNNKNKKKIQQNNTNNKLSISLPLSLLDNDEVNGNNINNNNNVNEIEKNKDEKKLILDQYSKLKIEYDTIKSELENLEIKPPEIIKKKKNIKKQLKALKTKYKEIK